MVPLLFPEHMAHTYLYSYMTARRRSIIWQAKAATIVSRHQNIVKSCAAVGACQGRLWKVVLQFATEAAFWWLLVEGRSTHSLLLQKSLVRSKIPESWFERRVKASTRFVKCMQAGQVQCHQLLMGNKHCCNSDWRCLSTAVDLINWKGLIWLTAFDDLTSLLGRVVEQK